MFTDKIATLLSRKDKVSSKSIEATHQQAISVEEPTEASEDHRQNLIVGNKTIEKLDSIERELGKIAPSFAKEVGSSTSELKGTMENLVQKLDETILSIKSTISDNSSPFNAMSCDGLTVAQQESRLTGTENMSEGVRVNPTLESLGIGSKASDAKLLVTACALLEIAGKNKKTIDSLRTIGLLSRKQIGMIFRIKEFLSMLKTPLRPRELALITCNFPSGQNIDEETLRTLDFLSGLEGAGEICPAMS